MKKTISYSVAALLVVITLAACKKNTYNVSDRNYPEGFALVKLGLFQAPTVVPNLLVYINGERVTGPIAPPYPYPGGGFNTGGSSNGDYLRVAAGENKIELFVPNPGTAVAASKFYETTQTLEANKKYTLYMTDTGANAVTIPLVDDAVAPDTTQSRIRFINLMPNVPSVDFYKGKTLLKADIKYKQGTEFFDIPFGSDSFNVRVAGQPAGSALSAIAYRVIVPAKGRIYSFLSRGYSGATGARAPNVSAIVNQ